MSGVIGTIAVVGTAVGAATSIYSTSQAAKASKQQAAAQRDSQAAQGRMSSAEAARSRIQQAREARVKRGQVIGAGSNSGLGSGTTGITGAVGSIGAQLASNVGTINQTESFAAEIGAANQRAADAQGDIMKWQGIGAIGSTIFSTAAARIK